MPSFEVIQLILLQAGQGSAPPSDNSGILWDGTTDTLLWDGTTDDVQWD